jgi:hypothetical protein
MMASFDRRKRLSSAVRTTLPAVTDPRQRTDWTIPHREQP